MQIGLVTKGAGDGAQTADPAAAIALAVSTPPPSTFRSTVAVSATAVIRPLAPAAPAGPRVVTGKIAMAYRKKLMSIVPGPAATPTKWM